MKLLYQFSATDSFIHSLDPRTKLLFVACYLVAAFLFPWPWLMGLAIIALIWALGGISPREYYPFLVFLLPIMVAITIVHLFIGSGPFWQVGFLQLSQPGLTSGLQTAFRLATMGITFIMFSMTTDPFDWGLAMYRAGLPYRVAFMFAFAMRFFPLLQEEMVVIRNALRARAYAGMQARNPIAFVQGVGVSVIPLGLNALRRSQDIALAMELRGYSFPETTGVQRVIFRDVRLRTKDWLVMGLTLLLLVSAIGYRIAVR